MTGAASRGRRRHSLALQQQVGLSEQRHLWPQAPLTVGQVANVTPQLLLALSAGLQLRFQPPQLLLQPKKGQNGQSSYRGGGSHECRVGNRRLPYLSCSVWWF